MQELLLNVTVGHIVSALLACALAYDIARRFRADPLPQGDNA